MYKRILHGVVLSCKKATFLTEKKLHTSLSPIEGWQLKTHLLICPYCVAYTAKAVLLDRLMADERTAAHSDHCFSPPEVEALQERFKAALVER